MNKKVLIVTFYNSLNAGAFLQANSLSRYISETGNTPYFIDGKARRPFWNTLTGIVWACIRRAWKTIPNKWMNFLAMRNAVNDFHVVSLTKVKKNQNEYDLCIFGSDEIWNLKRKENICHPFLWGSEIRTKKRISYAPSINYSAAKDLPLSFVDEINSFDGLSVRDNISLEVLQSITNKPIQLVLDPTFLVEHPDFSQNRLINEPYIFIYAYRIFGNEDYKKNIVAFARNRNLKIISMCNYCNWSDTHIPISPDAFRNCVQNAEYVFTDTFHGTVFSMIYKKEFICLLSNGSNKVRSLLQQFDLTNRIFTNADSICDYFSSENSIDYDKVYSKIEIYKEKSCIYLDKYLRNEENNE